MQSPDDQDDRLDLDRFLRDLRRTGTVITGPIPAEPADDWHPVPVEWLVAAHRGQPIDPPYRLQLTGEEFAAAVRRDAEAIERWWPGSDAVDRARDALLLSFDAALVGVDKTPHGFLLEDDSRLRLSTQHLCPDPGPHLDPDDVYFWSAYSPGEPEFEAELERQRRRSVHRRHADLVRAWLAVEAAMDTAALDPAVPYLQDRVGETFGAGTMQRYNEHIAGWGLPDAALDAELRDIAYADDERLDALLDALAGPTASA